jgi:hypothetical protein
MRAPNAPLTPQSDSSALRSALALTALRARSIWEASILVRRKADLIEAAGSYLDRTDAAKQNGRHGDGMHFLAWAAQCQEAAGQYEACIKTCRRIIDYEKAARAQGVRCMVTLAQREELWATAKRLEAFAAGGTYAE